MENNKQTSTLKNKIFKILPKAAASVSLTFQNPPFSPGRDHKSRTHGGKGFSGPMIPHEARRKPKDGRGGGGIETQEPTSPKVSCMGQIKHKKKQIERAKAKTMSLPTTHNTTHSGTGGDGGVNSASSTPRETENEVKKKKHAPNKFQRMFFHAAKPKTGSRKKKLSDSSFAVGEENNINKGGVSSDRAPPVGQMTRFASGRETFSNFDWRAQIAPEEMDNRDCFTDDDRAVESDAEEEDDDVIIPFSAPILVGGGGYGGRGSSGLNLQPRKEINLWKRRTMTPPMPLQLKPVLTAK